MSARSAGDILGVATNDFAESERRTGARILVRRRYLQGNETLATVANEIKASPDCIWLITYSGSCTPNVPTEAAKAIDIANVLTTGLLVIGQHHEPINDSGSTPITWGVKQIRCDSIVFRANHDRVFGWDCMNGFAYSDNRNRRSDYEFSGGYDAWYAWESRMQCPKSKWIRGCDIYDGGKYPTANESPGVRYRNMVTIGQEHGYTKFAAGEMGTFDSPNMRDTLDAVTNRKGDTVRATAACWYDHDTFKDGSLSHMGLIDDRQIIWRQYMSGVGIPDPAVDPIYGAGETEFEKIASGLASQGFTAGTISDREHARLIAKTTNPPVVRAFYELQNLYLLAGETPRL